MEKLKMLALAPLKDLTQIYLNSLYKDNDPGRPETIEDILDVFGEKLDTSMQRGVPEPRERIIRMSGGNYTFGSSNEGLKKDLENSGWVRGEFGENLEKFDAILDEYISEMTDDDIISVFQRAYTDAQESKKESDAFRAKKKERFSDKKKESDERLRQVKFDKMMSSLDDEYQKKLEQLVATSKLGKAIVASIESRARDEAGKYTDGRISDDMVKGEFPDAIDYFLNQNESTKLKGKVFNEYVEIILNEDDELDEYVEETVCEKCGGKVDKEMVSEEAGDGRPLFDVIDNLAGALEEYYEYSEEQAEDEEEFEDIGEAIGVIRKSFAMFQANVEDADKIIQAIISKSKGLE